MYCLNINPDAKPVRQQQRWFCPEIMEAIELEVKKLIDSGFVRKEPHPDWVANIFPFRKRMKDLDLHQLLRSKCSLS